MNLQHLLTHYRAAKTQHGAILPSLEDKLKHLERVFGHLPADTTGMALVTTAKRAWPTAAPGTLKRYLVQLRAVLRRSERDGLLAKAPLIDVPYVYDTVYVDISGAEVTLLLDYLRWTEPRWYPLALVLTQTGARLGEVLSLKPENLTRHGVRIVKHVGRKSKTVDRVIPYTSRLREAVALEAIFCNGRLVPEGIENASVSTCFGRIVDTSVQALGLPALRVHDLRHAFAAVLAEKGADLADIASALGHTNTAMAMRYRGLVKGRLTGIMASI